MKASARMTSTSSITSDWDNRMDNSHYLSLEKQQTGLCLDTTPIMKNTAHRAHSWNEWWEVPQKKQEHDLNILLNLQGFEVMPF